MPKIKQISIRDNKCTIIIFIIKTKLVYTEQLFQYINKRVFWLNTKWKMLRKIVWYLTDPFLGFTTVHISYNSSTITCMEREN